MSEGEVEVQLRDSVFVTGELERLLEQRDRLGEAALDVAKLAEQSQRSARGWRDRVSAVSTPSARARARTRSPAWKWHSAAASRRAQDRRPVVPVRGQRRRQLQQLGGRIGRSARNRALARPFQRACDALVRSGRGQGKMPRPSLRIADQLGQPSVSIAASRRRDRRVHGGGEQRMGERHAGPGYLDQTGASPPAPAPGHRVGQARRRQRGGDQQLLPGRARKSPDPFRDQLLEIAGHRQCVAGRGLSAPDHLASDLQDVERVAPCRGCDPDHGRSCQRPPEPLAGSADAARPR